MQGAVHFGAVLLASFGVACASTRDVHIDQRKDLAGYRTWNFLAHESGSVYAPDADARALDATLTRLIERCLLERGFERVKGRPDFYVRYVLEVRRQLVSTEETPAVESLSSLHESPSYEFQATASRVEIYETGHLAILVSEPGEQTVIWRGGFEGRLRGELQPQLKDVVASVLGHFPASVAASGAQPARGARNGAEATVQCAPPI